MPVTNQQSTGWSQLILSPTVRILQVWDKNILQILPCLMQFKMCLDFKSYMYFCMDYTHKHSNPFQSLHTSTRANRYSSSAGVNMHFPGIRTKAFIWLHSHTHTHTHVIVCPCAHGCISVCMLCVCILILTWKGTSTPIYYLLKIKSWRQTTVISVGQLAFPLPSQKALNNRPTFRLKIKL